MKNKEMQSSSGFEVNYTKFSSTLYQLALSKLYSDYFTDDHIAMYWEDLKNKRYIIEVMTKARQKQYKSRMPMVSDLIEDHRKYSEEIGRRAVWNKYLIQSKNIKRLTSGENSMQKVNSIPLDVIKSISEKLK